MAYLLTVLMVNAFVVGVAIGLCKVIENFIEWLRDDHN